MMPMSFTWHWFQVLGENARKLKSKYNVPIEIYQMGCKTLLSSSFTISCAERIQRRDSVCVKTEQKGMI